MNDETYNGWTNYETWAVNLHLANDQATYEEWLAEAFDCYEGVEADNLFSRTERAALTLSARMQVEFEDNSPLVDDVTLYADLLGAALCSVNWYEIAQGWVADAVEQTKHSA